MSVPRYADTPRLHLWSDHLDRLLLHRVLHVFCGDMRYAHEAELQSFVRVGPCRRLLKQTQCLLYVDNEILRDRDKKPALVPQTSRLPGIVFDHFHHAQR